MAWTIAGSDSGGGAGIQADIKVMNAFGVHGCSAITAITAQNTVDVTAVESVTEDMFRAQLNTLAADLPPNAIKTGMLGSSATCRTLAEFLSALPAPHPRLVCDPVLRSSSGRELLEREAVDILLHDIAPHAAVLTPNLPETEVLTGKRVEQVEVAAERFLELGVHSVLIKGGHADAQECRDYWTDGTQSMWLTSPRIRTSATHGTGCILSAAIASALAVGASIPEAVMTAKTFLNQCLRLPANIGKGTGPVQIHPFQNAPEDRPEVQ